MTARRATSDGSGAGPPSAGGYSAHCAVPTPGISFSIVDLRNPRRPLLEGDWIDVEVVAKDVIGSVGREYTKLHRYRIGDGRRAVLHAATSRFPSSIPASIEGFDVSPDASRIIFEVTHYPENGEPSSDVFVRDISSGALVAHRRIGSEGAEVRWLDDDSVLYTDYEGAASMLHAGTLSDDVALPPKTGRAAVQTSGGAVLGMEGARLSSLDPATGRVRKLAAVAAEYAPWVIPLPRALRVRGQAASAAPAPVTEASPVPPPPMPRPTLGTPWALGGAALATLALGALGVVTIRRRRG